MIPWRIKNFVSCQFPLAYHVLINFGKNANSADYWNSLLAEEWDSPKRNWPTKNAMIEAKTELSQEILDVACGTGTLLRYLKSRGYTNLWGLEHSEYVVERLGADGISMIKSSLPDIAAPSEKFDVVIASQVLEHIIRRRNFLKEIFRVLKPGGSAYIFVPDNCLGPIDEPSHVAIYTADSLRKLLAKYFVIEELYSMKDENFDMAVLYAKVSKK